MSGRGSVWKRCRCRDPETGDELARCPRLYRADGSYAPNHGSWYLRVDVPAPSGQRRTVRRGGFKTQREAQAAMDRIKEQAGKGVDVTRRLTVGAYLAEWVRDKGYGYGQHVRDLWVPQCGRTELTELRKAQVEAALATLAVSPATKRRYLATLSSALSDALREGLVQVNVAKLVRISGSAPPKALVWTDQRVIEWQAERELRRAEALRRSKGRPIPEYKLWHDVSARPSKVMVWTPAQVVRFLDDHAAGHRLYPLFHLIALRGLRRGEAVGLRRQDLDLGVGTLHVRHQVTQSAGITTASDTTKSKSGNRTVTLDAETVTVLREHLSRQAEQRAYVGSGWTESGYVFTEEDGRMLDPGAVTRLFEKIAYQADLPPIRLHDLRHSAVSVMHAAKVDMLTISRTLGHSNITITADIYGSVFPEVDQAAAEATAALIRQYRRS